MQITVFNQHHFNPDCPATCRHYSFLEYLSVQHKISLISSDAWRQLRLTSNYSWVPEGVTLHEQHVPYHNKMGVASRLLSYGGFAVYSFFKGLLMPKPDVIWAVSTPLSTPWAAAQVARLRGIPWVFEVQDLWPSFPIEMGAVKSRWLQQKLYALEKKLYKSAAHIITLSPDMTAYIAGLGIPLEKIKTNYNGTDLDAATAVDAVEVERLRQLYQLQSKQVVLYAGSFGRANDILSLLKAAELLASEEGIQFIFAGTGYYEAQVQETAKRLRNITVLQPLPRHQIFPLFHLAALSVVSFLNRAVLNSNSPAKFYDSLACRTPVIVTNAGWTKSFVEENKCGWYTPAENPEEMAATIKRVLSDPEQLMAAGINGTTVARKLFDRKKLAREVEQVLVQVSEKTFF